MKPFSGAACLLALTAGLAIGSEQIESKQAQRDATADTDPNSGLLARSHAGPRRG